MPLLDEALLRDVHFPRDPHLLAIAEFLHGVATPEADDGEGVCLFGFAVRAFAGGVFGALDGAGDGVAEVAAEEDAEGWRAGADDGELAFELGPDEDVEADLKGRC